MSADRAEEKRRLILDAALEVFAREGYHAATIAHIADKLHMGHGTFYRYFDNKLDIFRHVVDGVVARVAAAAAEEVPGDADSLDDYRQQVERIGGRLAAIFLEEQHLARVLFVEAVGIDPVLTERLDAAFDLFANTTEAYLLNGQAKGFLRRDLDAATTARAVNAMIFESVRQAAKSPVPQDAAKTWLSAVVTLMFDGIGA